MTKAYIIGATLPAGGAYMAYHLGRILHRDYAIPCINVRINGLSDKKLFNYDMAMEELPISKLKDSITSQDILIANPSFSNHMFGLTLPGRKLMYAQDFRTFSWLDCQFDEYVSVSTVVQEYLQSIYQISSKVVPAFINIGNLDPMSWQDRPPLSFAIYTKHKSSEHQLLKKRLVEYIQTQFRSAQITTLDERELTHDAFISVIGEHRYFINLSIAEGFGLPALEAMAKGCAVIGLDGSGGREYMKPEENCLTYPFKDWDKMLSSIKLVATDDSFAATLALNGSVTAKQYSYENFYSRWKPILHDFVHSL